MKKIILGLVVIFTTYSCSSDDGQPLTTTTPIQSNPITDIVNDAKNLINFAKPSQEDLINAGVQNVTGSQSRYKLAIRLASPSPTTLSALQTIIDNVNDGTVPIGNNDVLVWSDEFDTDGSPSDANWTFDIGRGQNGWGNNEVQFYTQRTDNVIIEDGLLKIIAKKESYQGADYTSTRMKTQSRYDFTYGKVEVRAKLPASAGTWPAIWMLGSNFGTVGWPACGEIDIMEQKGWDKSKISSALHNNSSFGATINVGEVNVPDSTSEFHVYGANWNDYQIEFSVDGNVFYTYNPSSRNADTWPYNAPQFIILNIAMGGNLGGDIPSDFSESRMEIDYVRVYQ